MILNHILVDNIGQLSLTKVNSGGFSEIYLTEIRYLYVYSSEDHPLLHPQQVQSKNNAAKMIHKYVVVKKEVGGGSRNQREIEVLKRIKNGCSVFLPKYYIVVNKDNPHSDAVVMDFIPSRNLKDFLLLGGCTVSLLTKLYLIFSIVQALRYIHRYRIAHLDLKPNNLMVHCNMLVKIIDFGESHHPELASTPLFTVDRRPGYTVPYSPPEIFAKGAGYSCKSDVFSLGVLIF
jgi:serine/threonine protein kinase